MARGRTQHSKKKLPGEARDYRFHHGEPLVKILGASWCPFCIYNKGKQRYECVGHAKCVYKRGYQEYWNNHAV